MIASIGLHLMDWFLIISISVMGILLLLLVAGVGNGMKATGQQLMAHGNSLKSQGAHIQWRLDKLMATLEEVKQAVQAEGSLEDSIITLLNGIAQQLKDALSGATLPPAVQQQVDDVFSQLEANKQKLADAVTANTPAAPTPPTA